MYSSGHDSLLVKLPRRITQDGLQRFEFSDKGGRITSTGVFCVGARVDESPSVILSETQIFAQCGCPIIDVQAASRRLGGALETGSITRDINLDHVDTLGQL